MRLFLLRIALVLTVIAVCADSLAFDIAIDGQAKCACISGDSKRGKALAREFASYVEQISGAKIPIVKSEAEVNSETGFIVRFDSPYEGVHDELSAYVSTDGKVLEITGDQPRGTVYALYTLIEHLGVKYLAPEYETITKKSTLTLPSDFKLVEKPAFDTRWAQGNSEVYYPSWNAKMRLTRRLPEEFEAENWECGGGETLCLHYLDPKKYFKEHPDWYAWLPKNEARALPPPSPSASMTNNVPCRAEKKADAEEFLSLGDDDESITLEETPCPCRKCVADRQIPGRSVSQPCTSHPEALAKLLEEVKADLRANPKQRYVSISFNDNPDMCGCLDCQKVRREQGGGNASLEALAANYVAKGIAKEFPNVTVVMLSYWTTSGIMKDMELEPNVMVCVAVGCNMSRPERLDKRFSERLEKWTERAHGQIVIWDYYANFRRFSFATPDIDTIADNLKWLKGLGVKNMTSQMILGAYGHLADLRSYIMDKFMWNPDRDVEPMIDEWFDETCGTAAPLVKKYYRELVACRDKDGVNSGMYGGNIYNFISGEDLVRWRQYFEEALDLVKDDAPRYKMVERMAGATLIDLMVNYKKSNVAAAAAKLGYNLPKQNDLVDKVGKMLEGNKSPGGSYWSENKSFDELRVFFINKDEVVDLEISDEVQLP